MCGDPEGRALVRLRRCGRRLPDGAAGDDAGVTGALDSLHSGDQGQPSGRCAVPPCPLRSCAFFTCTSLGCLLPRRSISPVLGTSRTVDGMPLHRRFASFAPPATRGRSRLTRGRAGTRPPDTEADDDTHVDSRLMGGAFAALGAAALLALGGKAISAPDKYAVQVPGGLASPSSGATRTGNWSPSVRARKRSPRSWPIPRPSRPIAAALPATASRFPTAQNCQDPLEADKERRGAGADHGVGRAARCGFHGSRQQALSRGWMGLCPVQLRRRLRRIHPRRQRQRLRHRLPYAGVGERLRFYSLPEAVSGGAITCGHVASDIASLVRSTLACCSARPSLIAAWLVQEAWLVERGLAC